MESFLRKCFRKSSILLWGSAVFATIVCAGTLTAKAETVQNYNVNKAISYAEEHYDDYKTSTSDGGDCVQFLKGCLEAGGVPTDSARDYGYTVEDYKDYLVNNGYAQMYELVTEKQDWEKPQWYVKAADNTGKLSVGDGILYECNGCGQLYHVAICNDIDEDGFAHYYAQHVAVKDKPLCKINHGTCTDRENTTLYALHITSADNGYGSAYDNRMISNLKVIRTGDNALNITWDAIGDADGYKVFVKNGADSVLNQVGDVSGTSMSYTEPTAGANYYFAVRPYFVADGKQYVGKLSKVVKNDQEEATSKLQAPEGVSANLENSIIKITWKKVAGADKYEVWRAKSENGEYYKISTVTGTSCTNSSLTTGTTYYYKVRAIDNENAEYSSDFSVIVSKMYGLEKPEVEISNVASSGKLKLTWNKVAGAKKYEIYRSTKSSSGFKRITSTIGTSCTNSSVTAGTKYYYKVKAISSSNTKLSVYSDVISGTCKLARPSIKVSVVSSTGKLKVSWKKVSSASKYAVYRATSLDGTYKKLITTSKTSYTDSKASAGTKYYYKVMAVYKKTAANSDYSTIVSQTCDLARPTVSVSNKTARQLKLTWKKVSGAQEYAVYRATSKKGKYSKIATVTGTSYINKSLKKGKTYYYKVVAVHKNTAANSAYSSVVSKKCK